MFSFSSKSSNTTTTFLLLWGSESKFSIYSNYVSRAGSDEHVTSEQSLQLKFHLLISISNFDTDNDSITYMTIEVSARIQQAIRTCIIKWKQQLTLSPYLSSGSQSRNGVLSPILILTLTPLATLIPTTMPTPTPIPTPILAVPLMIRMKRPGKEQNKAPAIWSRTLDIVQWQYCMITYIVELYIRTGAQLWWNRLVAVITCQGASSINCKA